MRTKKGLWTTQNANAAFSISWMSVIALFAATLFGAPLRAQEQAALAKAQSITQQLKAVSTLLESSSTQSDKAKASVTGLSTVQYSDDGAIAILSGVNLDITGRYAIELWATRSYYSSTPGTFSGIPIGKKIIGNYVGGSFLPNMWTIIPFSRAVPSGYYPTLLVTRDDGTNNWPYSVALSSNTELLDPNALTAMVFEFYAPSLNHYFVTANTAEAANLANNPQLGWRLTGDLAIQFNRVVAESGTLPGACRFYGHPTIGPNSHFYTADSNECFFLRQLQLSTPFGRPRWNYEEIAFASFTPAANGACRSGLSPVVRFYNNGAVGNDSNHRYVMQQSFYDDMIRRGWRNEGTVMCSAGSVVYDPAQYR
jgi:hypothetical protein